MTGFASVAFWNAERCKYLEESAALLARADADIGLLCEMDHGMARSGNLHTTREIAERLDSGHAFAVEFLELDLGDERERAWHAGEVNGHGLHGGAILSRHTLERPAVVRLDRDGAWFDGASNERRVGGRIAVLARLPVAGVPVTFGAVHFESHGDPDDRAEEMRRLLRAVEDCAAGSPVVLGGDFNTNSAPRRGASSIPWPTSHCSRSRRRPVTTGPPAMRPARPSAPGRTGRRRRRSAGSTGFSAAGSRLKTPPPCRRSAATAR